MVVPNGASIPNGSSVNDKSLAMMEGEGASPVLLDTTANDQYIPKKATKKNGIHNAPQMASFENFACAGAFPPVEKPDTAGVEGEGVPPGLNSVAVPRG